MAFGSTLFRLILLIGGFACLCTAQKHTFDGFVTFAQWNCDAGCQNLELNMVGFFHERLFFFRIINKLI